MAKAKKSAAATALADVAAALPNLGAYAANTPSGKDYIVRDMALADWGRKEIAVAEHEERRRRKLLVSRKQLARLWSATQREGMTLVPLVMYFDDKGRVKLKIAIAKGKQLHDKRATEATRDWDRQKRRLLKEHG